MRKKSGQSIIELLVAFGIAALMLPALITGIFASREGKYQQQFRVTGVSLLREAEDALRSVREKGWSYVSTNGTFHPVISGTGWSLIAGTEPINGLYRSVIIEDAYRDTSGALVTSGGVLDPSTKKVTLTISWGSLFPSVVNSVYYMSRLDNQIRTETTAVQFNLGTKSGTTVTNTSGGEVVLGAGGTGDWCAPNLSIAALDLPKNGVANAISAIEGRVFAGTGDNASGVSFANVNISNADPPVPSIIGTLDGYKTNDIFGEADYLYLTTDTNSQEVVIISTTTSPYSKIGSFDASGSTNGNSVYVAGNVGYMTQGNTLWNFDLSSKTGSRSALDSNGITLAGTGTSVVVIGTYAYVSISGSTTMLQIIDVSSSTNMQVVGQALLTSQGATDVYVNSSATRAYIVTANSSTQNEFFIIDTSTKTGNRSVIGSYDTNGMSPKSVTVVTGNKAIAVGTSGQEYQAIDISSEASPASCGGLNIDTGVNGVSSIVEADGDAYSYIITGDASTELKVIEGGPGGQYSTSGTYESAIFDATTSATFNRFTVNANAPNQTTITYQMAITDAVSGSCSGAGYVYVGPDKTSATFFATSSAIPLSVSGSYKNPARCFRYKAYLTTTDSVYSPILNDITINYSP